MDCINGENNNPIGEIPEEDIKEIEENIEVAYNSK